MEKTVENNILLAEFLGWKTNNVETITSEEFRTIVPFKTTNGSEYFTTTIFKNEDLLFHNDWRWLMEVVNKIDKTELSGLTFAVDILNGLTQIMCYGECQINGVVLPSNTTLLISESKSRIESTYFACVRFVEWFNKQSLKQ